MLYQKKKVIPDVLLSPLRHNTGRDPGRLLSAYLTLLALFVTLSAAIFQIEKGARLPALLLRRDRCGSAEAATCLFFS